MTSKILTFLLLILNLSAAWGQTARIGVFNPWPRVGDIITISFTLTKDSGKLQKEINSNIDSVIGLQKLNNGTGSIELKKLITKAGKYVIGPFSFKINGDTYTSNSIEINVDQKLPDDRDGFWIRQINWNGNEYLIFEQRIDLAKKTLKERMDSYNRFADLADNLWNSDEISFEFVSSTSPKQPLDDNIVENISMGTPQVIYSIRIYRIVKKKQFKGPFILKRKNFDKFPSNIDFMDFNIK